MYLFLNNFLSPNDVYSLRKGGQFLAHLILWNFSDEETGGVVYHYLSVGVHLSSFYGTGYTVKCQCDRICQFLVVSQ